LNDLTVFRNWPGTNAQKVPSAYSYSRTSVERKCRQWGYSIDDDSQVMRWTKLELEPRTTVKELEVLRELLKGLDLVNKLRANDNAASTNDIPQHISRDAGDIVREYLGKVAKEWYLYIRGQGKYTLDTVPLDIVVTHPAVSFPFRRGLGYLILIRGLSPGRTRLSIRLSEPSWAHFTTACFQRSKVSLSRQSQKHVPCTPFKTCS
jgi:hypothetical protein